MPSTKRPARRARRPNIPPYYWSLWAAQQLAQFRHLGYPRQVPFYQPARLSNVDVLDDDRSDPASIDDWRIAERIAALVNAHRQIAPREVLCLEILEGAIPDDKGPLEKRLEKYGINKRSCQQMAYRARRAVDLAMGPILGS